MPNDTPPNSPFTPPGDPPATNPFAGPPEPVRPIDQALAVAYRRACGEFDEYLPHGVTEERYDLGFIENAVFYAAETSAQGPLKPVLPAHLVPIVARGIALAAWYAVSRDTAQREPNW